MKNENLPEPYKDLMITFRDIHGNKITKRGFYCTLFSNFSIPPEYRNVQMGGDTVLLPHGFGGYHLNENEIIEWKYANEG